MSAVASGSTLLSPAVREAIAAEVQKYPQPRSALLIALHLIQGELGYVPLQAQREVAQVLGIKPIEVREVVTFYPMYHEHPVGRRNIQVCVNIACALAGARQVVRGLEDRLGIVPGERTADGNYSLEEVQCLGSCGTAVCVQVNNEPYIENVRPDTAGTHDAVDALLRRIDEISPPHAAGATLVERGRVDVATGSASRSLPVWERYLLPPEGVDLTSLTAYRQAGGYAAAARALGEMTPEAVVEVVKESGLRGRGGAGFTTGQKWSFMPKPGGPKPSYLACNADESEPGTFKDRQIMERNPHLFLEGLIIAGYAIHARAAYVYIRGEYIAAFRVLSEALREARSAGLLGKGLFGTERDYDIHLMRGAGAYICGEETGMIESAEGRKGQPRKRPPFPAVSGLWGCPTTVNNVETVSHVPAIITRGAAWFKTIGTAASTGNTLYGVSGHVNRPGVYELPLGTRLREIIEVHAGGVRGGRALKAIIPGGVSMPVLSAAQVDVAMDHDSLKQVGSLLGTGGIVVMDETACMVRAAIVIARFFRHETCGQCTQCREGTSWLYKLLRRIEAGEGSLDDLRTIDSVGGYMEGQTICALSDAAAWAATGFLRRFRSEFEAHVHERRCPLPESFDA